MTPVSVRYIVDDVDAAVAFYTQHLDFRVEMRPAPGFAMLARDSLRLLLNAPGAGGAGQAASSGERPAPGGWNRFQLLVDDLAALHRRLQQQGLRFKTDVVEGQGGKQALLQDPAGNLIELFEPKPGGRA
jgi:catechol 2,3-dioxygenase-like lactoylglutathione lyase family enzyme